MAGWVKISRKLLESPIMQHDGLCRLWMYCLVKANWKPGAFLIPGTTQRIDVNRGAFITGRKSLHAILYPKKIAGCPSESTLWRWMQSLESMGAVSLQNVNNHCTMVTVCNYETYQDGDKREWTTGEQPTNNRRTTDGAPLNTIEEGKKERREEEYKETPSAKSFEVGTRNKRHPMAEYLPEPNAAVHGIEDNGELVMYQDDPERWEALLVRWWNKLPGIVPWQHDGLDDFCRKLLYERMLDPKWTWRRTIGEFPLHFPSNWEPGLDWFLSEGNVTKILGRRFKETKRKPKAKSELDIAGVLSAFEKGGNDEQSVFESSRVPVDRGADDGSYWQGNAAAAT